MWLAFAWVLLVSAVHLAVVRWLGAWVPMHASPPPRLSVQLSQRMQATAPPMAAPRPKPKMPAGTVPTLVGPADAASAVPELAAAAPDAPLPSPPSASAPALNDEAGPPAAHSRDGTDAPGPEWPLSTQLRYQVLGNYQGPVHGDAEVEWLRQGRRYQVRLRVGIGPKLTPIGQRRLISEGRLTPAGIAPERYDEETQFLWRTARHATVRIEGASATLPQGREIPVPLGVQDSASQFVHLTWLLLTGREPAKAGHVIALPLALPQGVSFWRYELVEQVELETALGRIAAWHLRPQPPFPPGTLAAQVWLAPSYQYLPVQIRIEQGEGVWMTLTLAEPPLQEAVPPDNAAPKKESPP